MALPAFLDLCRAYLGLSDELLTGGMTARVVELVAHAAWGSLRGRAAIPQDVLTRVRALWSDGRLRDWHPRQRLLLVWFGVLAAAAWSRDESWSRGVLDRAAAVARRVWVPASWQPWMGRRALEVHRPLALCTDVEQLDPSGDPEEPPEEAPVPERPSMWTWSSVGEVLDGLDAWQAAVQEHFDLPVGDMRRLGHPGWQRLGVYEASVVELKIFQAAA